MNHPHTHRMVWTLRFAVLVTCIGTAGQDLVEEGPLFKILWMGLGWSEATALMTVRVGAYALVASALLLFWRPAWPLAIPIAAWLSLRMVGHVWDDVWHPWLIPLEWAVRVTGPVALAALSTRRHLGPAPGEWILKAAAAATFAGHGMAALLQKAEFVDLIIASGRDVLGVSIGESAARSLLLPIGVADLALALVILLPRRFQAVALWMALWGFLTAITRFARYGDEGWYLVAIRALNGGAPLALLLYWNRLQRTNDTHKETRHEDDA